MGAEYERQLGSEQKKRGGVYYTPAHIVEYIVGNTVSKLIDPNPVTVLDPACGSGAFLIGAYQYLLNRREENLGRALTAEERARVLRRASTAWRSILRLFGSRAKRWPWRLRRTARSI